MKKMASVIVMVISTLLFIVMLAGMIGAWWGQGQLRGIVTQVTAAGDRGLVDVQAAVIQVNDAVQKSMARLDESIVRITKAGATTEEKNLAIAAAELFLDRDLDPAIERINQRVSDTRATVAVIDTTLGLLQRLPGGRDNQVLATADDVIAKIRTASQDATDSRAALIAAQSRATNEVVTALTTRFDSTKRALVAVSEDLGTLAQRIELWRADLMALRDRVLIGITIGAVILTLAFLWMAFAQAGLFVHAYGAFTGRDPLARLHPRKSPRADAPASVEAATAGSAGA